MCTNGLRREVLKCFKSIHRTRKQVFNGDERALVLAKNKINEEFKKNKHVVNTNSIMELIKFSKDVEQELKTTIIQAKLVEPGKYEVRIRPETTKLENVPYKDNPCSKNK